MAHKVNNCSRHPPAEEGPAWVPLLSHAFTFTLRIGYGAIGFYDNVDIYGGI